jgi:hypothetical protein
MADVLLRDEARDRAVATFGALRSTRLFSRKHNLFGKRRWWLFGREYETLWPFADAWSALATLGSLPGREDALSLLHGFLGGLRAYSRAPEILEATGDAGFESVVTPPLGGGGDRFFDDNAWLGLALVRHHELTGTPELLRLAERVFSFVVTGWSTDASWHLPGGLRWKEPVSNRSRNTCVNGPAAELAARLYEKTGAAPYLDWATRIYGWSRSALLGPDRLYVDQIAPDGQPNRTIWSYNQGTMIGAGVLLAGTTGDSAYLDQAVETATAFVDTRGLSDLMAQDPAFNAVLFRNLLVLDRARPDPRYRSLAGHYATAMWTGRRIRHGFFEGKGSVLNNTAAMLQIYALLAGAEPHV